MKSPDRDAADELVDRVAKSMWETWRQQPVSQEWARETEWERLIAWADGGHDAAKGMIEAGRAEARAAIKTCASELATLRRRVAEMAGALSKIAAIECEAESQLGQIARAALAPLPPGGAA